MSFPEHGWMCDATASSLHRCCRCCRSAAAVQELALQETVAARQTEVAQLRSLLRESQATASDQKQALLDLQVV